MTLRVDNRDSRSRPEGVREFKSHPMHQVKAGRRRMKQERRFYELTLQFVGGESDRSTFSRRLNGLKGVEALVYPDPTPTEKWVYSHASSADFVVNSVVMIIATAGSIATITHLIYDFLKDRTRKKELDRRIMAMAYVGKVPPDADQVAFGKVPNKVLVRSDSKEVEITGDFSKGDIIEILKTTARVANHEEASSWLLKQKNELEKHKIEQELRATKEAIAKYRELLEAYEKDDKLESWQKKDYRKYKARMNSLKHKAERLKKRLEHLEKT